MFAALVNLYEFKSKPHNLFHIVKWNTRFYPMKKVIPSQAVIIKTVGFKEYGIHRKFYVSEVEYIIYCSRETILNLFTFLLPSFPPLNDYKILSSRSKTLNNELFQKLLREVRHILE